ncbi:Macoilin [Trichinella nelsoni]|uniref:Macoilin n=1 Tax=Trichinella nelsoni TaxID=6336 RepID=A0A0V0RLZ6_9BILA|nr:Macoilin [Trichinella nelsoni]
MKRRTTDNAKLRRAFKKNKMPESLCGSSLIYFKMLLVWTVVMMADFVLDFRFEYFWPFWLMLRCIYDSFRYQGMTFTVFFVCVTFTSDVICFIFVPVQWVFFIASTYVWVQYVWHAADRGICLPTTTLWMIFLYVETSVRLKELKTLPFTLDLCRPLAAHCIGYPVVTLGFDVKSYVSYRLRLHPSLVMSVPVLRVENFTSVDNRRRRQKEISRTNQFYWSLLFFALPADKVSVSSEKCKGGSVQLKEESGGSVRNGNIVGNGGSPTTDGVNTLQVALPRGTVQSTGGSQSKIRTGKQSTQPAVIDCEPTLGNGGALFSGVGGGSGVELVSSPASRQRQNSSSQKQIRKRRTKFNSKKVSQNDPVPYQEPPKVVEEQLTSWWWASLRQIFGSLDWLTARFGHNYSGGVVACNDTDYADSDTSSETKDEQRKLVDCIPMGPPISAANKQANNSKLPTSSATCTVVLAPAADRTAQNRKSRRKGGGGACGASTGPTVASADGSGMDIFAVRDATGSSTGTLARIRTVTDRDTSIYCGCEVDLEKMKIDLRTSKSREQELRLQLMEMSNVECSLKSELNELKINNEQLQTRVQNLLRSRQQDRQVINGLEKKIAEEQKAKAHLDQQLQQERRASKKAEEAAAALISSRHQAVASSGSHRNGDCEQCRRRRDGEKELKHARKELTQREEQIGKLESEVRNLRLFKESNAVEQLVAAVAEMERKNSHLESSLSAETRIKLDLFSALGESKRQHEIVLGQLDEQRKVIVDLQRRLNEFSNGVRHHGSTTQSPQNTVSSSSLSPPPQNAHCNLAVRGGAFITSEGQKVEQAVLLSPSPPVYSPTYIANVSPFVMEEPRCSSYPAPNMQARILNNKIGSTGSYRFKTQSPQL